MNDMTQLITRKISFEEIVDKEARLIVTSMIEAELDKQNLPLPKESSLTLHVDQILKSRPDIIEKARQRVDAKLDAYTESLRKIGVKLEVIRAIEITL
jgi:lysyl-tRNA synthetase class I